VSTRSATNSSLVIEDNISSFTSLSEITNPSSYPRPLSEVYAITRFFPKARFPLSVAGPSIRRSPFFNLLF